MNSLLDCHFSQVLHFLSPVEIARLSIASRDLRSAIRKQPTPQTLVAYSQRNMQSSMEVINFLASPNLCCGKSELTLKDLKLPDPQGAHEVDPCAIMHKLLRFKEVKGGNLALQSMWVFRRLVDAGYELYDIDFLPCSEWCEAKGLDESSGEWIEKFDEEANKVCDDLYALVAKGKPVFVVEWDDTWVNPETVAFARKAIDDFAAESRVDYHPASNDVVRDILHPSLFCLASRISTKGMVLPGDSNSLITPAIADENAKKGLFNLTHNFFGRSPRWLDSSFQWIPVDVVVGEGFGSCKIVSPLNNIDWQKTKSGSTAKNLVLALEKLLQPLLPALDRVWRKLVDSRKELATIEPLDFSGGFFSNSLDYEDPRLEEDYLSECATYYDASANPLPASLAGRTLQVIPKIAEYQFDPAKESKRIYEGAFHIEAMPTENIVATAVHILDRDELLEGGDIQFKRQFTREEFLAGYEFGQNAFSRLAGELFENENKQAIPLGTLPTPEGRSFVFPNYAIHKVNQMGLISQDKLAKALERVPQSTVRRRIVVFFLIDPTARICSSSDLPPISDRNISFEEACANRIKLMEERSISKGFYNKGYSYGLCEH